MLRRRVALDERRTRWRSPGSPRSRSLATASREALALARRRERWRPSTARNSARSATRSSSSAVTARRSRPSTSWRGSSRASPRTRASRTHESCSAIVAGAIAAMRLAAETAVPGSEAAAWTALQLGKLFFSGGDHAAARERHSASRSGTMSPGTQPLSTAAHRSSRSEGRSRPPLRSSDARSRPCPCRSTSPPSATSCRAPGRLEAAARQYALVPPSTGCSGRAASHRSRAGAVRIDHGIELAGCPPAGAGSRQHAQAVDRRRTTPSRGRSRAAARCVEAQALLEARAPPGHGGRAEVLPPRDDRALPRSTRPAQVAG